ncbi:hypothetical protein [Yoonia sp. MH D7]
MPLFVCALVNGGVKTPRIAELDPIFDDAFCLEAVSDFLEIDGLLLESNHPRTGYHYMTKGIDRSADGEARDSSDHTASFKRFFHQIKRQSRNKDSDTKGHDRCAHDIWETHEITDGSPKKERTTG